MRREGGLAVIALCAALASTACGGGSSAPAKTVGNVTITGTLAGGSVQSALVPAARPRVISVANDQLYCVTFSSPPASGTATADSSGNVSLTLAALDVPFGCFILDSGGSGVATLFFSSSSASGETVTLSGDADLGTITVDPLTGLASATLPQSGALATTPSSAACPVGTWSVTIGQYTCDSSCTNGCEVGSTQTGTSTVWIAQSGPGQYTASFTHIGCNSGSHSDVPGTFASGTFVLGPFAEQEVDQDVTCTHSVTASVTTNSTCTSTTTATSTWTNCGTCGSGDNVCSGCGTQTCTGSIESMTRQ
ncbi:MAG TPA: hypothetical protein VMU15_21975 [Anaeromyxobacter sp.]|nr:hypothetical protein [Anaeromyxobacter sp.]